MSDKISLARVGSTIVLMVEVYPTGFMMALSDAQAASLGAALVKATAGGEVEDLSLNTDGVKN